MLPCITALFSSGGSRGAFIYHKFGRAPLKKKWSLSSNIRMPFGLGPSLQKRISTNEGINMATVLVTGGTGTLGRLVVRELMK